LNGGDIWYGTPHYNFLSLYVFIFGMFQLDFDIRARSGRAKGIGAQEA
jgi:hypothetical protein